MHQPVNQARQLRPCCRHLAGGQRKTAQKTLTSSIAAIFPKGVAEAEIAAIIQKLQSAGAVTLNEGKVSYVF
jgi:hypothetical protein